MSGEGLNKIAFLAGEGEREFVGGVNLTINLILNFFLQKVQGPLHEICANNIYRYIYRYSTIEISIIYNYIYIYTIIK